MKLPEYKRTQVCSGDSGGPIFMDVNLITIQEKTLLYQITKRAQVGVTVWVDTNCSDNFNGFIEIKPYLGWFRDSLDAKAFAEIEERIYPTRQQIELFDTYKKLILDWRKKDKKRKI